MMQPWFDTLSTWREFYALVGAIAATLMGLMFVVMSLGGRTLATEEGVRVTRGFFTPIVVFFATIIVVAMLMLIPRVYPSALAVLFGAVAIAGLIYMISSGAHRVWRTSELGIDDLMWYVVLPYVGYAATGVAAGGFWNAAAWGEYVAASAMLLFLIIGIRNAWDLVVYNIQRSVRE